MLKPCGFAISKFQTVFTLLFYLHFLVRLICSCDSIVAGFSPPLPLLKKTEYFLISPSAIGLIGFNLDLLEYFCRLSII